MSSSGYDVIKQRRHVRVDSRDMYALWQNSNKQNYYPGDHSRSERAAKFSILANLHFISSLGQVRRDGISSFDGNDDGHCRVVGQ